MFFSVELFFGLTLPFPYALLCGPGYSLYLNASTRCYARFFSEFIYELMFLFAFRSRLYFLFFPSFVVFVVAIFRNFRFLDVITCCLLFT